MVIKFTLTNSLGQHFDTALPVSDRRLSMDTAGVIAHYVMDTSTSASTSSAQRLSASSDRPFTAETGGNTNFCLYGLGAIGEKTTAWSFSLPDGTNTPRQLSDINGDITLSARYTPWGNSLELHGTGNPSTGSGQAFTFGYIGSILDTATGLLYVGNGQYYTCAALRSVQCRCDPSTGRFLTRGVNPDAPNPYVPWNPIGAILGPLGLIALVYGRRKKGGKWDTLLIIVLIGISAGIGVAACGPVPPVTPAPNPNATAVPSSDTAPSSNPNPNPNQTPGPITIPSDTPTSTPPPPIIIVVGDCPTATSTATSTPTPLVMSYNINFTGTGWTSDDMLAATIGVEAVARKFAEILGGTSFYAWSITFGYINLQMGGCDDCLGTEHSGHTSGAHQIEFAGMSDTSADKRRNLVIHELGHAFKWLLYNKTSIDVYTELTDWRTAHADYPDRQTFSGESGETGPAYGFHSLQNQIIWQQSLSGEHSEEFADQFLGWVFNKWQENPDGSLHRDGKARADMMNSNMPYWVSRVAGP